MQVVPAAVKEQPAQGATIYAKQDLSFKPSDVSTSRPPSPSPDEGHPISSAASETTSSLPTIHPSSWSSGYDEETEFSSSEDRGRRAQQNSGSHSRCQSPEDLYFNPGYLLPVGPCFASPLGQAAWSCTLMDAPIATQPAVATMPPTSPPAFAPVGDPPTLVEPQPWKEDDADASFKETKQSKELPARWSRGRRGGAKVQQQRALQRAQSRTSAGNFLRVH